MAEGIAREIPSAPRTSPSETAGWVPVSGRRPRGGSTTSRMGCSRSGSEGRRLRDPRRDERRVVPVRLRARPDRRRRGADLREQLAARLRLRARPLGVGRRARRGRRAAREGRRGPRRPPRLRHVLTFADLPELEARGRELRGRAPGRARRRGRRGRRGRPLHLHLHLGHDRAAQGLHDPAPQLLRDGGGVRQRAGPARGDDTMLLYLPLAHNFGRLLHLDAAVRRASRSRSAATRCGSPKRSPRRPPDDLPERAARLREGAYRRPRAASTRRHGPRRRLGEWALRVGREASRLRQAGRPLPRWLARRHRARRPAASSRR